MRSASERHQQTGVGVAMCACGRVFVLGVEADLRRDRSQPDGVSLILWAEPVGTTPTSLTLEVKRSGSEDQSTDAG